MTNIKNWITFLNENTQTLIDFNNFPDDIRKTLENEYGDYQYPPNWNEKQDEFIDNPHEFSNWLEKYKSEQFIKNIENIIRKTTQDMILLKRKMLAKMKLDAFEELIIPSLGDEVLTPALSKFEEEVLMNPYLTIPEFQEGMKNAKGIFDDDGNIDPLKVEKSKIFVGGDINLPAFERFIKNHPEFKGAFDHWKKLFDDEIDLSLIELNAYRDSTPIEKIRNLRNFLINYKKNSI